MLLRRIYQTFGILIMLFSVYILVMSFTNIGQGSLSLGLALAAFKAVIGFIIYKFATGPAESGINVLGISEKALSEKEKSLAKKAKS